MDLERLDEALERYENDDGAVVMPLVAEVFEAARAYRDLLANGERVKWCEEHRRESPASAHCDALQHIAMESCRIISALLIPPTEKE